MKRLFRLFMHGDADAVQSATEAAGNFSYAYCKDPADLRQIAPRLLGPNVESGLNGSPVLPGSWGTSDHVLSDKRIDDIVDQDECRLADRAQEAHCSMAAQIAPLFFQEIQKPDIILVRPLRKEVSGRTVRTCEVEQQSSVGPNRSDLRPISDYLGIPAQFIEPIIIHVRIDSQIKVTKTFFKPEPFGVDYSG